MYQITLCAYGQAIIAQPFKLLFTSIHFNNFHLFTTIFSCCLLSHCLIIMAFVTWFGKQISVSLCKGEPDTPLFTLMKKDGATKVREALTSYVEHLKTGQPSSHRL